MSQSNGRFSPPNIFSEISWDAVWNHVKKQKTTNIIGIYNCKIFYSTYISILSSYTQLSNTDNIEIYLGEGLDSFFKWAGINKNKFISDSDYFISYNSYDLIDPYVNYFSDLFFNEIKSFKSNGRNSHSIPYFMLLFEVDAPTDHKEIYDDQYFFECDIEPERIEEFYEIIYSNFEMINNQFDLIQSEKVSLKLEGWEVNKSKNMIYDQDFFEKLVIKPFTDPRCQICGDFTSRDQLSLNVEVSEGWILPMCPNCKQNNI